MPIKSQLDSLPHVLCVGALGLVPCSAVLAAAETPEEPTQVTVTATRIASPVAEVPATVTVISAAKMEKELVENIEDLVRFEPGVSVRTSPARFTAAGSSTGRDGNSGFNIRGLEGNRVLIQVDGIRTPDAFSFGAQSVGRGDYVDLSVLKSVEILRGSASALYGSDGLAGAVSFITKDPADLLGDASTALRLRTAFADADQNLTIGVTGAVRLGGWEAMAAYTHRDGEGQQTQGTNDSANTDRTTANPEDNQSNAALVKLVREIGTEHRVRLTWDHVDRDAEWIVLSAIAKPPLAATSVLGLTAFDEMNRDRLTLDHFYETDNGWLKSLRTSIYTQASETRQYSAEDRNTAADRTRDARFDNTLRGLSLQADSLFEGDALSHQFTYGGDYSITRQESVRDGTVPPAGEVFPTRAFPNTDYTLAGVFLQDKISWKGLSLFPALRWDSFRIEPHPDALYTASIPAGQSDSRVSPKLGVVQQLRDGWSLFANAGSGFKAPGANQVNNGFSNLVSNYQSISNPDLKPETSRTVEGGIRRDGSRWSLALTGFSGSYDDFIEQAQVGGNFTPASPAVYQFINLQKASIYGWEVRAKIALMQDFSWTAAGAWTRGESEGNGITTPLQSIDPLRIVSGLEWEPTALPVGVQLTGTYTDRKEDSRLGITCSGGCYVPDSSVVLDAIGWWKIGEHTTLRAGLFNATDESYTNWADVRGLSDTSVVKDAYTQPGRNFSVSLTIGM